MIRYAATRANALVLCMLITVLSMVGLLSWDRLEAARSARVWSLHTYDVLAAIKDMSLAVRDAESGQRGFLLTGKEDYLEPYQTALDRVGFLEGELQRLTADSAIERGRLRELAPLVQRKLEELAQTVQLRRTSGSDAALALVQTDLGRGLMKDIEAIFVDMTRDEQGLLARRMAQSDERGEWLRWLVCGGTAGAVLTLLLALVLLNRARSTAQRAENDQRVLALRLRASLDSISQGLAVFGADRRLTEWNRCFEVLLALPPAMIRADAPYSSFFEHAKDDAGAPLLESEAQLAHGRAGTVGYERSLPNGQQLEFRRTTMPDSGFVLTVSDTTERAQAEAVLRESQKMQAIGQLTGGIAHDFNNLLTVILGNLEFIGNKLEAEHPMRRRVERAAKAAQRGAALTSHLLSFARRQPLAPTPIDLAAATPDLVPLLRRTLGEHIDVRYVETAGLWPAMADAAQLESAVLNLALNARDAMPEGGRLTIELANKVLDDDYAASHAEVSAGDYSMLAVSDTGRGMSPAVLERVFEPFFTTKPNGTGTGLGLAMVFGFVKQSKGHVKIYSEPGEGTTVRIYLPRANAAPAVAIQRSPVELPKGSATVLVVEDEPAVREIAIEILGDLGYRVLSAADGEEALRVFGANAAAVDLLLTDVVLPGALRGRDIAERIVAIRPQVRVLFMSGYTENSIVHHGRLDEGVQLIGKPFKREQLARRVADILRDEAPKEQIENVVDLARRRDA